MTFYFDSLEAFIAMDGHGLFVWLCYFMTVAVFASLYILSWAKRRMFLQKQIQVLRREQR